MGILTCTILLIERIFILNTYELLDSLRMKKVYGMLPATIQSIEHDSRSVKENSMFICIRGFTSDGHKFYADAIKNGATIVVAEKKLDIDLTTHALVIVKDSAKAMAILANKFYDYPSTKMTLYGVTGTNGKTTVTTLMKQLLQKNNHKAALLGTNGMELLNESFESDNTTADVITNQRMLHRASTLGVDHVIMEVSSHGLSQGRQRGIDFDIVTFTNLSQDHLDYHESMDHYGNTKSLLFSQLGNDLSNDKIVVLNKDDDWYDRLNCVTPYEVISYGIYNEADFKAANIYYDEDRTTFTLHSPEGSHSVETKLIGEFNVYNTLAAIASIYAKGEITINQLVASLSDTEQVSGRMQKLDLKMPVTIYIDYAHTPDAIEKAIASVYPFKQNRIIFVAGTGGDRDTTKRPLMAEKASVAEYVVLTVNDSRFEDPQSILTEMEKGMKHQNYARIPDRAEAIRHAIEVSEPGDILIIAGKGLEEYQIIEDQKHPHSDLKIATEKCSVKYNLKV